MEEFSPLFWVLLTVGVMVYSSVSRARKAAKKGRQPRHPHGEAWPAGSAPEPAATGRGGVSFPETTFPDEGQSLEEIPASEYETPAVWSFTEGNRDTDSDGSGRNETENPPRTADGSPRRPNDGSSDHPARDVHESTDDDTFDLRRAVIETEILKPRFDDEKY